MWQTATPGVISWVPWACHLQKIQFCLCPPQPLALIFLIHSGPWDLEVCVNVCMGHDKIDFHLRLYSIVTFCLQFNQLWTSALTTNHCTKKCVCQDLGALLTYGYRDECLEDCLALCSLSKVIIIGSSPKHCGHPNHGFLARFTAAIMCFTLEELNPRRKWLVTPMTFMPLLHL